MTIDDSVFAPVAAKTNLYRDLSRDTWRIRIPERANLALDTVVLPGDVVRWADEAFGIVVNEFYGLAAYKYPRVVEFVEEFPLTSSGKISRRTLRARAAREE